MKARRRGESGEVGMARVERISQLWTAEHTWNMRFFFFLRYCNTFFHFKFYLHI